MTRRNRVQAAELTRHVMSRGNGRMCIFLDDTDYRRFIYLLGEVAEEFGVECWNYCVMPNHYHATLQPTRSNLSQAIGRLNGVYAQWWNKRHGRVGHVFQGRFKDQIVQCDAYLLALSRYVVMNPVRAQLVQRPDEWPWSSYRATVGLSSRPAFLRPESTLRLFGDGSEAARQSRFAQYMSSGPEDEATADRIRSNERVLGDRAFKALFGTSRAEGAEPERAPVTTRQVPGPTPV